MYINDMIGIFFLNTQNEYNQFCLVALDKFEVFEIKQIYQTDIIIKLIENVIISNKKGKEILKFEYNPYFHVFGLIRRDHTITFYNLCYKEYFSKYYTMVIPVEIREIIFEKQNDANTKENNIKTSIFNIFKSNKDKEYSHREIYALYNRNANKFSRTQLFLHELYEKLYVIVLYLEESKILLYQICDLNVFVFRYQFLLGKKGEIFLLATLQFIDNLIIFYDFANKKTKIFDIKRVNNQMILTEALQIKTRCNSSTTEEDLYDIYSYNIENNIFIGKDKSLYIAMFDPEIFLNINEQNPDIMKLLITRSNAKNTIFKYLQKLIREKNKINKLDIFFFEIFLFLKKESEKSQQTIPIKRNKTLKNITKQVEYELHEIKRVNKKNYITPEEMYLEVFSKFQYENSVSFLYIIEVLIILKFRLMRFEIFDSRHYNKAIMPFIAGISRISDIQIFIQFETIPINNELALLLIEKGKNDKKLLQMGLDILTRNEKYEDVVYYLVYNGYFKEAMIFLYNHIKKINIMEVVFKIKEAHMNKSWRKANYYILQSLVDNIIIHHK